MGEVTWATPTLLPNIKKRKNKVGRMMGNREGGPVRGLVKSRKTAKGLQNKSVICGMDGFGIQFYVLYEKKRGKKKAS